MTTKLSPERHVTRVARPVNSAATNFDDLSHVTSEQRLTRIAVTERQRSLVLVAIDLYAEHRRWPTASALAIAADVAFPDACRDLKVLAKLGCVAWSRSVKVVRQPDGLFLSPDDYRARVAAEARGWMVPT